MKRKKKMKKSKKSVGKDKPRCGLCGKPKNLTKTECCENWICDDEHTYKMFSYAKNSCSRNHRRYTICGYHHAEEHSGTWQECPICRDSFETEMYVWYGTNEFNFEKLENPPEYEPTKCSKCGTRIILSEGGYSSLGKEYFCDKCTELVHTERLQERKDK
ncbi:MAG: hypothetical protein WBB37_05025 [bacterium]